VTGKSALNLVSQLSREPKAYTLGAALLALQQLALAARDLLVRTAVDGALTAQPRVSARAAALVVAVSLLASGLRVWGRTSVFSAALRREQALRETLLMHLLRLGPSFFQQTPPGDLMNRATSDLSQIRLLLSFGVLNIVASVCGLFSALSVMLRFSWKLTLASLAVAPALTLVLRFFSRELYQGFRETQAAQSALSDRMFASFSRVRLVRTQGLEPLEEETFARANRAYTATLLRQSWVRAAFVPLIGSIASLVVLAVFGYGVRLVLQGDLTRGDLAGFWVALLRLLWPLMSLGLVFNVLQRGKASFHRLDAILTTRPEVEDGPQPPPEEGPGDLRVEALSFAYGTRQVLDNVSFQVPRGHSLAIIGKTGSGKSTLARLLARLSPTPAGTVFLDGTDVCTLPLSTVRKRIACSPQDAWIFATTALRNLEYALEIPGAPGAEDRLRDAAAQAHLLSDLESLPNGFQTVVGERGVQLSGGQRARLALARALARNAPVLVLDEPLTAVDARTEAAILEALLAPDREHSLILMTHRLALASRCDEVLVLEEGRVIERGAPAALLTAGGRYAALNREQAGASPVSPALREALP